MTRSQLKIFGVIGDPVNHSLSPFMHNAGFAALKFPGRYRRFQVGGKQLGDFLNKLRTGEISGVNVTIPHKQKVMDFLDKIAPEAKAAGAVNTIVSEKGKLVGYNTDGEGYVKALLSQEEINLAKTGIVVLGAGGAALGICHALVSHGARRITILNRDPLRAERLGKALKKNFTRLTVRTASLENFDSVILSKSGLLINTTCLGMKNHPWQELFFLKNLPRTAVVSDIVYVPRRTALLVAARKLGLKTHEGWQMLLHQGLLAFKIFTGEEAPEAAMERALMKALKR